MATASTIMFMMSGESSRSGSTTMTVRRHRPRSAGARRDRLAPWRQLEPADQPGADRGAGQSAADDAERRRGERQGPGPDQSRFLQQRRERESGRRPADQRDRSRHHAEQRVLAESPGDGDAEEVLHEAEHRGEEQEDHDLKPAGSEQREARPHPDGAEEGDAQQRLRRRVELHAEEAVAARQHQQREEQPAHHRGRNVEPVEPIRSACAAGAR